MKLKEFFNSPKTTLQYFIIVTLVVVVIFASAFLYIKNFSTNTNVSQDDSIEVVDGNHEIGQFYYPYGGFTIQGAEGWLKKTDFEPDDPVIGSIIKKEDVEFAFEKKEESCVLVYGLITGEYGKQTSFAKRVFTADNNQIDSSWYVRDEYKPEGLNFMWTGEQPIPYEKRVIPYLSFQSTAPETYFGFILYASNKGVVSRENCDADVSSMLSSIKMSPRPIEKYSDGLFYISSDLSSYALKRIMMIPKGTKESFASDLFEMSYINPILHNDNLFYISNTGSLFVLNLKSLETKTLISAIPETFGVNGFTVLDNVVYYLAGIPCNEYRAKCNNGLYQLNLDSGVSTKLYEGSSSRKVLGKDSSVNKLYLAWIDGDAGCSWGSVEQFDLQTNQMIPTDIFHLPCADEEGYEQSLTSYTDFLKTLDPKLELADYWKIENGTITTGYGGVNTIHYREAFYTVTNFENTQ